MKTKTRKTIQGIFIAILILSMIYPLIFWVSNPELTQMQVFNETWYVIVIGFAFGAMNLFFEDKSK